MMTMMFPTKAPPILRQGRFSREPFDPARTYTATRTMVCNGKLVKAGEVFNKNLVNTRRLRQMYEQRMLAMVAVDEDPVEVVKSGPPAKPEFVQLSSDGLRLWLKNNGYVPKPRTNRTKLLELCEQKWKEYIDGLTATEQASSGHSAGVSGETSEGDATPGDGDNG